MRILVTGSSGGIGKVAFARLESLGHEVRPFDIQRNDDLRDFQQVREAAKGCDTIVHIGAIPGDSDGHEEAVLASNAQGTWNILLAAVEHHIPKVIHFSSIQALGVVGGHHPPLYLPLDDAYPRHPRTPYQIGKHLGEETCKAFSERWGITTITLRPMLVAHQSTYVDTNSAIPYPALPWKEVQESEGMKNVLWAYTDIEDLVDVIVLAVDCSLQGHHAFLVASDDTTMETPTLELVRQHWAHIPQRIPLEEWTAENPYRSLVDCSGLKEALGWSPKRHWRDFVLQS